MSAFEFISVSVAIVLAITLGKLMTAVNEVFDRERRDLLHIGFYVLSFVAIMTMWWAQWLMVSNENWTFAGFVLVMASPIAQYFTVHALLTANPSDVQSWRDHMATGHRWYFSAMLAQGIAVGSRRFILSDDSFQQLPMIFISLTVAVAVWAIVSPRRVVHIIMLVTWSLGLGVAVAGQFAIAS